MSFKVESVSINLRLSLIKPWDDETDMKELEAAIRSITMDGLLWGTGKLVEIG